MGEKITLPEAARPELNYEGRGHVFTVKSQSEHGTLHAVIIFNRVFVVPIEQLDDPVEPDVFCTCKGSQYNSKCWHREAALDAYDEMEIDEW